MKLNLNWLKGINLARASRGVLQELLRLLSYIVKLRFIRIIPIRYKLIGLFLIVSIVPIALIGMISYAGCREIIQNKISNYTAQKVSQTAGNVQAKLIKYQNTVDKDLTRIVTDAIVLNEVKEVIYDQFQRYLALDKTLRAIYFFGEHEKNNLEMAIGASSYFSSAQLKGSRVYMEVNKANNIYWNSTAAIIGEGRGLIAGKVIRDQVSQAKIGVLFVVISEESFCDYMNPDYEPGDKGNYFVLIDRNGKILVSPHKDILGQDISEVINGAINLQTVIAGKNPRGYNDLGKIKNNEVLITFQKLKKHDWYLLNIETGLFQEVNYIALFALLLGLLFIGGAVFLSIYVSNQVLNSVKKITDAMKLAENGDLSARVEITSHDEFEHLSNSFNEMLSRISQIIINTQAVVNKTMEQSVTLEENSVLSVKNTENVAAAMGDISKGSMDQINEIENASLTMGELAEDIGKVVAKAADVEIITDMTKNLSFRSKEAIENLVNKAKVSTEITNTVIKDIEDLNANAVEIGNFTEIIGDIAEKTNLLALNAAIEAARAGEAGRGFAIVAKEVNKLAVQAQTAAQTIEDLLQVIKAKTSSSAKNVDKAYLIVDEQAEAVRMAESAFEEIIRAMDEVISRMTEMSVLIQKVDSFKDQTMQSIINIGAVAEETAAATEEVTAASQEQTAIAVQIQASVAEIRSMAENLVAILEKFKVAK